VLIGADSAESAPYRDGYNSLVIPRLLRGHCLKLTDYHPVVIEGMGGYDPRDPAPVAMQVAERLAQHWARKPPSKPLLILTQGDPLDANGISAITPRVAQRLGIPRAMIYLDEHIADYHWPNADRLEMIFALKYSEVVDQLNNNLPGSTSRIEAAVEAQLKHKNDHRTAQGNPPLNDYFRDFALLQEVTKAACSRLCEGTTIAHTSKDISVFSVTSFFVVGLELGLVDSGNMVSYSGGTESRLTTASRYD
jgi:hypothetical protein